MDIGKAFTFITEDERWIVKLLIAIAILFITPFLLGIPYLLFIGYQIAVTRNVMNDEEQPLPEWEDWGKLFMDGLYIMIARIIYTLPFWLLFCVSLAVGLLPALAGNNDTMVTILAGTSMVAIMIVSCLVLLLIVALIFIAPAISIQYVRSGDEFGACFQFGQVIELTKKNIGDIFIVVVVLFAGNFVLNTVSGGLMATGCGLIIGLPLLYIGGSWLLISSGHLYGQIAAKISGNKEEKFAV